ncbi:MAG: hypothetical protein ACM3ML_19625 [Micromonosporaceae bacterium]
MDPDTLHELSKKMITFLETGTAPDGLFQPDVLLDLSMPTWRLQTRGAQDLQQVRKDSHPGPSTVTRWRSDPTTAGFVFEFEERWSHQGEQWYAREMMRADVADGAVAELAVYCTGDWDEARQREHARTVNLLRA